jgi:hypothetical protein
MPWPFSKRSLFGDLSEVKTPGGLTDIQRSLTQSLLDPAGVSHSLSQSIPVIPSSDLLFLGGHLDFS